MRIALACPNFPPEFLGGTERVTLALARALTGAGDEVVVLTGSDEPLDGEPARREELEGIAVRRIRRTPDEEYGLDLRRPRVLAACRDVLEGERCEVLHLHHWATLSTGLVREARALGLATVVTLHDVWATCARFFRRPPAGVTCPDGAGREPCVACVARNVDTTEAWIAEHIALRDAEIGAELEAADRITAPSRACADRIALHAPLAREIAIVPHGLLEPVGDTPPVPRTHGKLRVGTFGNLVEEKGVDLLVWACKDANVELHLFGPFLDPSFEAHVRRDAERFGVALSCHGPYDSASAHPARQLDVAVFPSLCAESYGLVVEEALARGVPVVVSDRGALPERVRGGGLVVPVDAVEPLARTLRELAADRGRLDELRRDAPRSFSTIHDAAARYRELYAEVRG